MPRKVPKRAWKQLQKMSDSRAGWGEDDYHSLYTGFGFSYREGRDRVYFHRDHPDLPPAPVGRHRVLSKSYADTALQRINHVIDKEGLTPENTR